MKKILLTLLSISATTQLTFTSYPQDEYAIPAYPINSPDCNVENENKEDEIEATEHPIETALKLAIVGKTLLSVFAYTHGQPTPVEQLFLLSLGLAGVTSLIVPSFLKISNKQKKCDYYAKAFVIVGALYSEYLRWSTK